MPGIDTDLAGLGLDALPARLARLMLDATAQVERRAAQPGASPDATLRSVGVIARTGAAFPAFAERLARLRARGSAGLDETEEADMDDAEDADAYGAPGAADAGEAERIERGLRRLARDLPLAAAGPGDADVAGGADPAGPDGQLGLPGAGAPVGA